MAAGPGAVAACEWHHGVVDGSSSRHVQASPSASGGWVRAAACPEAVPDF